MNISELEKSIQTLPKKLKIETLNKKTIFELFDLREKEREKILRIRTLGAKKIISNNLEIINDIIRLKIVEYTSELINETKEKVIDTFPLMVLFTVENTIDLLERKLGISIDKNLKDSLLKQSTHFYEAPISVKNRIDSIFLENKTKLKKVLLPKK